ncbi:MAG: hypothetical protein ACR2GX_01550 [Candidatus Dormibacteria bacterium]
MDNRSGRRRGHAYHADQARRALGINSEIHTLADVPLPIVHAALGVAACAVAVALRPGVVGLRASVAAVGVLALATGAILAGYDRLVYPPGRRPSIEAVALPVAALVSFALVLAGTLQLGARLAAGAVAVLVVAGVPHLGGLRATGREGFLTRFFRDAAGVAVLIPVFLAGVSSALPPWIRLGIVVVGVSLVTLDGLLLDAMRRRHSGAVAVAVAAVMAGCIGVIGSLGGGDGTRAAVTLILWYGVRGVGATLMTRPRRWGLLMEYAAVVAIAMVAVRVISAGR